MKRREFIAGIGGANGSSFARYALPSPNGRGDTELCGATES